MGKESKSSATIRRRRYWGPALREVIGRHKSAHGEDNLDSEDEDQDFIQEEPILGPPVLRLIMSSQWTLFLGLLAFRAVNALTVQTSYVPDEHWQSIEVAHKMAYGYGYMTWEWKKGIRSYLYPLTIAAIYKVLGILHLDYRILLIKLPRLLHALCAATGDLYLYKLSCKLSGHQVAQWSLLCQLTSWFTFYCSTRTLTNSVETVLTTVALYYFPWPGRARKAHWKYITVAGIAVVVRPTAAVIWSLMCVWHLSQWKHATWKIIKIFAEKGFIILSVSSIIDRYFYGKWVNVPYNFLQFNVVSNQGAFYGSHPWHWYLSQGIWVILGSHAVPFILALRKGIEPVFLAIMGWNLVIYSLLSHKEFRFLFPILPMAMHVCGSYLHYLTSEHPDSDSTETPGKADSVAEKKKGKNLQNAEPTKPSMWSNAKSAAKRIRNVYAKFESVCARFWKNKQYVVTALLVTNIPMAMYTCVLHQRGTLDVMKHLSDDTRRHVKGQEMSVMFLMPCHSTPYYSYLHKNITMRFLTCDPDLGQADYQDEAADFYEDPPRWLQREREQMDEGSPGAFTAGSLPSHLVMFSVLRPAVDDFLSGSGYVECARFFHTHFPEGRVGSHVLIMCQEVWYRDKGYINTNTNHGRRGR